MKTNLLQITTRLLCAATLTLGSLVQAQTGFDLSILSQRFNGTVGTFRPPTVSVRPTLVVLIHGGTSNPEHSGPSMFEGGHHPDTLAYSRFYFDFPFTSATLGVASSGQLFTRNDIPLSHATWATTAVDQTNPDHLFAFSTRPSTITAAARKRTTAVGFVHANGALRLGVHARTVLQQIGRLYTEFAAWAGADPYLVLVGHSKGGLVSRYIMSAPTGTVAGVNLTAAEENACRFLRDQTKYIVTLGTPHNGSPLSDQGLAINQALDQMQAPINALWNMLRTAARSAGITLPAAAPINFDGVRQLLGNASELIDLTSSAANQFNTGEIRVNRMVRSNGTPVPMYCYGGRTPGDRFYATPRHDGLGGPPLNTTEGLSAMGLCGLDWALHNIADRDWGTRTTLGAGKSLDLARRTFSVITVRPQLLPPFVSVTRRFSQPFEVFQVPLTNITFEGLPIYFMRGTGDGETDSDGMVAISSALAIGLSTTSLEPFDRTQGGQIFRMYGTAASPWAFCNHRTLSNTAPMGTEVRRLLLNAGPRVSPGPLSVF